MRPPQRTPRFLCPSPSGDTKHVDLGKIKHNDNKFLSQSDIHYDNRNNYITFTQYSKLEFIEYSKLIKKLNKESRSNKVSENSDN